MIRLLLSLLTRPRITGLRPVPGAAEPRKPGFLKSKSILHGPEIRGTGMLFLAFLVTTVAIAEPTTRPADPVMDELLSLTTRPATQPATAPSTQPLVNKARREDARQATLTLSNGQVVKGTIATTPNKPIRIWDDSIKDYRDIPFNLIKSAVAQVVWEREEREWTFRESGSDVKVYSGRTYPARELVYVVTLLNDQKVTGGVVAPLYWESGDTARTYVLHKRDKGEVGQKLADLVYVKRIDFD